MATRILHRTQLFEGFERGAPVKIQSIVSEKFF